MEIVEELYAQVLKLSPWAEDIEKTFNWHKYEMMKDKRANQIIGVYVIACAYRIKFQIKSN